MSDGATDAEAGSRREQLLAETFVMLADTLVDDYDVLDLLDTLVSACVQLLGVSASGLLLLDLRGDLTVIAASSEESRLLELCQLQANEGPCLDCVRSGTSVSSVDLMADQHRWPTFAAAAMAYGYRSVEAVPMRLRAQTIGGLNMFSGPAKKMSASDQQLGQALADVATIGILQQRMTHRTSMLAEQLQHALDSRVLVEQAKGVLAERNNVDMELAFSSLRRFSRNNNRKLSDVALAVIRGELDPRAIEVRPSTGGRP